KEGTRRLALLLWIVGALFGAYVSFLDLDTLLPQWAHHRRFEQLANSEVVQQVRKSQAGWVLIDPKSGEREDWNQSIDKGGINTIHWAKDNEIDSILTQDGQTLYQMPAPSIWEFLVVPLFPIFGFFIPWGATRAIGWVIAGFIKPLH
ncbi:MAG: hypothetical protein WBP85_14040, partial [Terracidiphilus sp.]